MIEWKNSYSVGNDQIDRQHRKLLMLCNQCEALLGSNDSDAISQLHLLLNDLSEYVLRHFDYEEKLLQQSGYSKLQEHIAEHGKYWEHLANILMKASSGLDEREDVLRLVQDWWLHHILEVDMQYSLYLTGSSDD